MEKIAGHLSPEDELYLAEKLSTDVAFQAVWKQLEEESEGLASFMDGLDAEEGLKELRRQGSGKVRAVRVVRWAVAAAVLVLVVGGYFIWGYGSKITDKHAIATIVSHHQEAVHLTMGDGKTVMLDRDSAGQTVVAGGTTLQARGGSLQYQSVDTATNTLSIPAGRTYRLKLSDGTEVVLNSASTLRFPFVFNAHKREVFVDGEAYFSVAKDASRPFIVHTSLTQIDVLGTSFNVNTYNQGSVTTSLVEGKISLQGHEGHPVTIEPGYAAGFVAGKGFSMDKFDQEDVLSWMSGTYYFHNMPVARLTDIMSRCYGLTVVMDKAKLANISITGIMDKSKLTEFLDDLETTAHIKYYYSGSQLRLE
jgi:ferric-dicitrate binding protein FerR (iron transport regulator)